MGLKPQLNVDYHAMVSDPKKNHSWLKKLFRNVLPTLTELNINTKRTIVCISDTHGHHRKLHMPAGDILIHSGDYVLHGKKEHAIDFNKWLGELPYKYKIVVQGNHEYNAAWKNEAKSILSNATLLQNEMVSVQGLKIYGTGYFWKFKEGRNPEYDRIPENTDVIVSHQPAKGYLDDGQGCPVLLTRVKEVKPKLVLTGHIHGARKAVRGKTRELKKTVFVNSATVADHHHLTKQPIVVRI